MEMKQFVYSLVWENNVFYIGKTKNIASRYRAHLNSAHNRYSIPLVAQYIKIILERGDFPDVNIIDYLPEKEATELEGKLIECFSKAGHFLRNTNRIRPIMRTKIPPAVNKTRKMMIKAIRYKEQLYIHYDISRQKISGIGLDTPWPPYPQDPF